MIIYNRPLSILQKEKSLFSVFRNRSFPVLLFETLTAYEKLLSQTSCVHRGTCWCCNIHINREEKAIVKIFLASEIFRYHQLRIDQKLCPHLIESETRQSRTIQCFNCSTSFTKYCIAM